MTSIAEILGYARAILDSFGLTPFITAFLFISAAAYVYNRFISKD